MADDLRNINAYAIDFGTSNTVIARWNRATQQGETVKIPQFSQEIPSLPPVIPSLLYVEDAKAEKTLIGQQVRDRGLDLANNSRCFRSFKRGIATDIQGFLPELDGINLTFEQIGEWFLKGTLADIPTNSGENIESLVLTVPVDSFEAYRLWLTDISQSLSIEQIRILDEPTAAALGYGAADQNLLLVIDFGGGTLDLSLIRLAENSQQNQGFILKWGQKLLAENPAQKPKIARVLAKAGKNLGGSDIDNWLVDYFATEQGLTPSSLVTRLAERLKIKLSGSTEAEEVYFNDETLESYELNLTRDRFKLILQEHQFFTQLDDLMSQVLQQARRNGIEVADIDSVLLVGGTVQIPAVQDWVKQYFPEEKIRCDRPITAIATGALQVAQGIEVQDFLYHSYGIRYWNRRENRHSWHPLIKSGQPYPMNQPVKLFLGASVPNQPSIELIIGELGTETATTEVYFDGDRLVTRTLNDNTTQVKPLNDKDGARTIAQLDPPGNPGSDRLKLQFWVNKTGYLCLTVEDILTGETLQNRQIIAQLK